MSRKPLATSALPFLFALPAFAVVQVQFTGPPGAAFDPSTMGTAAPVWNGPSRYETWAEAFRRGGEQLFRFPNGSLSNAYHWNGVGTFNSTGIWHPSDSAIGPGFVANSLWRGTTKDNYGERFPSHLTDGDTNSLWWGETFQDTILPWAILDLGAAREFDSVEVLWGALRPDSVRVETWTGPEYPPVQQGEPRFWHTVGGARVRSGYTAAAWKSATGRFVAIRPITAALGVQIREVRLFRKGVQVTVNVPDPLRQTRVVALSTHPGSAVGAKPWVPDWTFDRFMEWLRKVPGSQALVCVNFGTGTPEEAAAWVRYANVVKKYGIRRWQVGNEMDGIWEEGSPVDPAQYSVRFAAFSRAMKAVDPSIEVYGPATYSTEFERRRSGRLDSLSWMESFLWRIGRMERQSKTRLLDGVDFHAYPYWFEKGPASEDSLLAAVGNFGPALDLLKSQMERFLENPGTREISLSEFNSTVKVTALTLEETGGLAVAMMLQDLWSRHPDKALSVLWEPMSGEPMNPDGSPVESYGALRMFTPARRGLVSDLADPPTGAWWGQFLVRAWMGIKGTRVVPVSTSGGALRVSAATDARIWSVLAINPSFLPETLSVHFPEGVPSSGELLSWGPDHYHWTDPTSQARAIPNLGPTSRALAPSESTFVVPPRSLAIVRRGHPAPALPHVLHAAWTPGRLQPSDTLVLFASVEADGHRFTGASWNLGKAGGKHLPSFDGAWDGSFEAAVVRIPAMDLPRGIGQILHLVFSVDDGDSLVVPVKIDNEDVPRPLALLDDFSGPVAKNGQGWWNYGHSNNGTRMELVREGDGSGYHLAGTFRILQPPQLSYANFALAGLNLSARDFPGWKRFRGMVFDLRTRHDGANPNFLLQALTTAVKDYDDYQIRLDDTHGAWERVWVRWDELKQAGWGKDLGPFDPEAVRGLQFRAEGQGSGVLEIKNLAFWGTEGDSVAMPEPARPTREPPTRDPAGR